MIANNHSKGRRDPDTFDVRGSLRRITRATRDHKWLVILTCLLTLGLVTVYVVFWPPVYTATAMLMVERDTDPVRDSFYIGWNVFRKDDARTEMELMRTGPILKEVVQKEDLAYEDVYHPFFSHATYLWETSAIGKKYRQIKYGLFPKAGDADAATDEEIELGKTIVDLCAGVTIEPIGESNVGRLTVRGPSRRVASIANTLVDVYLARRIDRYGREARKSYEILTRQVADLELELQGIERRRLAFVQANGLTFDFQKESLEVAKLTNLEETIATSRMNLAAVKASLAELEKQLQTEPATRTTASTFERNAVREAMKHKRLELQISLVLARSRFRDDSPEVREMENSLTKLDAMVAEASEMVEAATTRGLNVIREELASKRNTLRSELEGARAGLAVLEDTAAKLGARLAAVPTKQAKLRTLDREYALAQEKYRQVMAKQAQARVSLATTEAAMPSMRVVEYAVPPARRSWPKNKILYPVALILGLVLGIGGALIRSYTSGRVLREHVEGGRGAAPLVGTIGVAARGRPLAAALSRRAKAVQPTEPSEAGST